MHRTQEIDWHLGDDEPLDFSIFDPDPEDPDLPDITKPVDLSQAQEIRFGIAAKATDDAPLVTRTKTAGGIIVTGQNSNVIRVQSLKTDVVTLTPGRYYYEVEVVQADGREYTGPHGPFKLHASLLK